MASILTFQVNSNVSMISVNAARRRFDSVPGERSGWPTRQHRSGLRWRSAALLLLAFCAATGASAAELRVLSGGAVEPGIKPVVAAFEAATGHHVTLTFNSAPQIAARVDAGEAFDVVIAPVGVLDAGMRSTRFGRSRVVLGGVGLGIAVRSDAPQPSIVDADAVRRAVLDADRVVYNRASTGLVTEKLLAELGITKEAEAKAVRPVDGAAVMERLLVGQGREFGFGALTEIGLFKSRGIVLVGPLPEGLQRETIYAAAAGAAPTSREAADALLAFIATPRAQALLHEAGISR